MNTERGIYGWKSNVIFKKKQQITKFTRTKFLYCLEITIYIQCSYILLHFKITDTSH